MQNTNDLHDRYLRAMQAQRDTYPPPQPGFPIKKLWLSLFFMMIGLLALFWLFFIEPLTAKKGPIPDWVNRPLKQKKSEEEEEEPELSEQQPPYSMKPKGLNGHQLSDQPDEKQKDDTE